MTALCLDDLLRLKLDIVPIEGVDMVDIVLAAKKAAYIEISSGYPLEGEPLEFYFCNKNGARLVVGDESIRGILTSRDYEPGDPEYAIYCLMGALDLLGEIEHVAIYFDGVVLVWIESFPSHSDVCGGTP